MLGLKADVLLPCIKKLISCYLSIYSTTLATHQIGNLDKCRVHTPSLKDVIIIILF